MKNSLLSAATSSAELRQVYDVVAILAGRCYDRAAGKMDEEKFRRLLRADLEDYGDDFRAALRCLFSADRFFAERSPGSRKEPLLDTHDVRKLDSILAALQEAQPRRLEVERTLYVLNGTPGAGKRGSAA